jgi:hypothetical protein
VLAFVWALVSPLRRAQAVPRRALWVCVAIIAIFAIFGYARLYDLIHLGLRIRLALGLYFGATLGLMVWPVVASWIGGASLHAWNRRQWAAFLLLLFLLPLVTLALSAPIPLIHYATGFVSVAGLIGSWLAANTLIALWAFRWNRRWTVASRVMAAGISILGFAAEVGLLACWRNFWLTC